MAKWLQGLVLFASLTAAGTVVAADVNKRMEEAQQYLKKGEMKAAVIELKNLLQDEPDNIEARLLIAEAYLKLGDGPSAAKSLEKARDLKAPKDRWIASLGRAYLLQNNAKAVLESITPDQELPEATRAAIHSLRGIAHLGLQEPAKAEESFASALKIDPDATDALVGLAMLEAERKQYKKAVEYVGRVAAKDDKNINAWSILGEAKRLDGDNKGALEAFNHVLALQPNELRSRLGRATVYLSEGKSAEAAKDLEQAQKIAGEAPLVLYLQAVLAFQEKKLDEAETALDKVLAATPNHLPSKLLLGTVAYQKGRNETAETQLSQYLAAVPRHLAAAKLLGATRMKLGRPADAIEVLKSVEDQAGDDPQFLALLGSAYLQNKQFDLGTERLARAAELAPDAAAVKAQLALGRMAGGQVDQAVVDLKSAVDLDPNLLQADVMLVLTLIQQKKFDEAIDAAEKMKAKHKGDPMPDNFLGAAYMAKGNADKAKEHWEAALKLKPEYATAALNLAKLELSRNNPDGAVARYRDILKQDPKNLQALLGLAQVADSRKDYQAMESHLKEARERNPKAPQPLLMLSRYYLAVNKPLQALEAARDADANNPDNPQVLQNLALVQMANNQSASALTNYRKLVNKAPDNPLYRHQLAQALYKTGDKPAADREWRELVKRSPDFLPAIQALGELAVQDKKFDEAMKLAEQIKAKQPDSPLGSQFEGDVHFAKGQFKAAVAAYEKAEKLGGTALSVRLFRARRAAGDDQAAFDGINRWLEAHPNDADALLALAMSYQQTGKAKEAVAAYEKLYALQPGSVLVLNNLAWMYQEAGDKRAMELAEKLRPLSENNPEVLDTVGWIMVQNGQVDKGLAVLQDAAVHAPHVPQIRLHVAEALIKAQRKDEARRELERLLKDKKQFPERAQAEALLKGL